jgi:hypothetical protein
MMRILLILKADSLRGLFWRLYQLADCFEQGRDFLVATFNSLLQFRQFSCEFPLTSMD